MGNPDVFRIIGDSLLVGQFQEELLDENCLDKTFQNIRTLKTRRNPLGKFTQLGNEIGFFQRTGSVSDKRSILRNTIQIIQS